jgi:hypothetical protein
MNDLRSLFFGELKEYNNTNYVALLRTDLSAGQDAIVHKAFSSAITRYFIFKSKHPEISNADMNQLYYTAQLDQVALYFAEYPGISLDRLKPFQDSLLAYEAQRKEETIDARPIAV